ncbi:MAG TPA: biopolymer transporter ExbD [Albitalea sp.]|nr:biopolymer transporter ExbD [Albitalea sp.]
MRVRRLRKEAAHLEITAFINLIVVLVPFLLSTAVFTRLAVLELKLPAQNSGVEQLKVDNLQLEIVIRPEALEVGDRIGGLIQRIPNAGTAHDTNALSALMVQLKTRFPDKLDATVLAEPNTPYDTLVHVMDATRGTLTTQGPRLVRGELFPNISIGDAPTVKSKGTV